MKYVCEYCGKVLDEEELPVYNEDYGFETGIGYKSIIQEIVDTCNCGGNFVEATECEMCGEYFNDCDDIGICNNCLEENATFENAIKIGDDNPEKIYINGYLASEFTNEEIEEILRRELVESSEFVDKRKYKEYCIKNQYDLAEIIGE